MLIIAVAMPAVMLATLKEIMELSRDIKFDHRTIESNGRELKQLLALPIDRIDDVVVPHQATGQRFSHDRRIGG
ncbi:hypothetical protein [Nitrobacter winogradskyi]|uniref:hypothetical protein n=1 Tax=Nitrobacter winogradskyi TaxID=913 RepID=UPI00059E16C4|nr:hypothetical protein [Nitrobacter winogradskyi]